MILTRLQEWNYKNQYNEDDDLTFEPYKGIDSDDDDNNDNDLDTDKMGFQNNTSKKVTMNS